MAPIAITPTATPPPEKETTSNLTAAGIEQNVSKTAPSLLKKSTSTTTQLSDSITNLPVVAPSSSNGTNTPLAELDASLLQTTHTTSPRSVPAIGSAEMSSQKVCTDHMIQAKWTLQTGWEAPSLQPFGPLALSPTASCLHYATECFEGMKLYRGYDGKLRLFRPKLNCNRMVMSANRIALPAFPPDQLLKLIVTLCETDGPKWLPKDRPGHFLYIRPAMIGTDAALGVERPKEALLMVLLTCFAPMGNMSGGIKLLASQDDMCRAWPGGFGYAKVGGNYGGSLLAQGKARSLGYHQILWLFGEDCIVTEAGASNFFVVWRTEEGKLQLVTADLNERIVLDGVTRRSLLELTRSRLTTGHESLEPIEVVERKFSMFEVEKAAVEGRLVEAFAAGTAWFIAPISHIHFRGKDFTVPQDAGDSGKYTQVLKSWLKGIMWGEQGMEQHEWGHVVEG